MKQKKLRLLHLEDDRNDFELTVAMFESAGFTMEATRVETEKDFRLQLGAQDWDLVLADYNLPGFNGIEALEIAQQQRPDVPFILVSGTLGEERAIEALQKGASDYILKQRMQRLVHATGRAIEAAKDKKRRINAEKALRESEERHRRYLRHAPSGIFVVNKEGIISWCNLAACETAGYTQNELVGMPFASLLQQGNRAVLLQTLATLPETSTRELELFMLRKAGEERRLVCSVVWTGVNEIMLMTRDVTREHELQVDLFQAQKRESIGRLAGGVAHDFNNMLSIILGYSEELSHHPQAVEEIRSMGREIVDAARHSARLTNQLLAFSRKQSLLPVNVNLNETITFFAKMLARLLGEDIELEMDLSPELAFVFVDKGQLGQIIMNLAVNARDAMPSGGKLTIVTQNTTLCDDCEIDGCHLPPGDYVELQMRDTGCGMDNLTISNAFEPFFTTKPQGKGTGLGLSSVYGVVKQSKGEIVLQSKPHEGTLVRVFLPAVEQKHAQAEPAQKVDVTNLAGKHILVVEDETSLARILQRMLKQADCTVTITYTAEEALEMITTGKLNPDLLLADVVLPGMHGGELAMRAQEHLPHLQVLFMSGYTDDVILSHGGFPAGTDLIRKPFTYNELRERISRRLPGIAWH